MFLFSILLSAQTYAATPVYTYTYQTTVTNSSISCQAEADKLLEQFQKATGVKAERALCRNEQIVENAKIYSLGLVYKNATAFSPYVAEIGKRTSFDFSSTGLEKIYPDLQSCQMDLTVQTENFEKYTALKAVVATCDLNLSFGFKNQVSLRIEGFDKKEIARPVQALFHFAPKSLAEISSERQLQVSEFLSSLKATIVKQAQGAFAYYREGNSAPIGLQELAWLPSTGECARQLSEASGLFVRSGSAQAQSWCDQTVGSSRLVVLFEGYSSLQEYSPVSAASYVTLQDCLNDREFVLSDIRNSKALGAVCSLSTGSAPYSMKLYRRSW